jgi:hypothetical protein
MARKLTAYNRAEKWYARQVKQGRLRDSDYSALSRKMSLCYEPSTMMNARNEQTLQDKLQIAKQLKAITDFKL